MFVLLTGVVFFAKIKKSPTVVEAGWWDQTWVYRQKLVISNNTAFGGQDIPYKSPIPSFYDSPSALQVASPQPAYQLIRGHR